MLIHGTEDKIIPISHATALNEAIREEYRAEPFWVMGKGHNDIDYNFAPYVDSVTDFLYEYLGEYCDTRNRGRKRLSRQRSCD